MKNFIEAISDNILELMIFTVVICSIIGSTISIVCSGYYEHREKIQYIENGYSEQVVNGKKIWIKE